MNATRKQLWSVTRPDHCGSVMPAKSAEEAVKKMRRYRGYSTKECPILCVRLFWEPK